MIKKITILASIFFMLSFNLVAEIKELSVDLENSSVSWLGKKLVGQHDGIVKVKSGKVIIENQTLKGGEFEIDLTTIENKDMAGTEHQTKLEGHLKSNDFFNIEKFPTAKFVITSVDPISGSTTDFMVKGNLTVKGITFPVTIPTTIATANGRYSADGKVKIDRTKWDIRYNSGKFFDPAALGDKLIYDDIEIGVKIVTQNK